MSKVHEKRRLRAVLPVGVALTALAASGCAAQVSGGVSGHASVVRITAADQGIALGAGQVGTRASVPWRLVGPSWTLAEYAASTAPEVTPRKTGPTTLYLIDPAGGRYRMYRWAAPKPNQALPYLVDWSGDKTRALIQLFVPNSNWLMMEQITLASGKISPFRLPSQANVIGYTKPNGLNVLATLGFSNTKIVRYNLRGQLQAVLARGSNLYGVQSPDGITLAVSDSNGLLLVSNAGGLIRRLPVPANAAAGNGCYPERWWNARTILAGCFARGSSASRLWLIPAGGHKPTALTPQRNGHGVDPAGDIGAWQLPSGLYLQAVGGCSALFIVKQARDGSVSVVNIPGTTGGNNRILAALRSRLLVRAETGCPGSDSLLWFNPVSHAVQMLLRAPSNIAGVLSAVPYGRLGQQN